MAITATDIQWYLSGGAGNADPNASLGGAISATQIVDASTHNLFDAVASAEATAGDIEYRCLYAKNAHATLTWQTVVAWLSANTPGGSNTTEFGLGTAAVNGTEQTVADESTAPTGITWSSVSSKATGLSIGDIPAGQHKAIWLRRTIAAGAGAVNASVTVQCEGDTAA